jgi:signal peptidase II
LRNERSKILNLKSPAPSLSSIGERGRVRGHLYGTFGFGFQTGRLTHLFFSAVGMKRKYWILLVFCLGILLLDQWTKYMIVQKLPLYQRVEVIQGLFNIVHVRNTGGAFGIFGGEKGGLSSALFVVVSLIAVGAIVFLFVKVKENEKTLVLSFSLILSGAIGNLIDRLRYGEVVDFLDIHLSTYHWPAFNVADSAICIGIGLMALELLIRDRKKSTKS